MEQATISFASQCFIFAAVLIPAALVFGVVYRQLRMRARKTTALNGIAFVFVCYYVFLGVLTFQGGLSDFSTFPPIGILPIVVVPMIAMITLALLPATHRVLAGVSTAWLISFQAYRILAEIMILLLIRENVMPETMTFTGRNFDIVTALSAPLAGYFLFVKPVVSGQNARRLAILWNLGGALILVNTVVTALRMLPTPLQSIPTEVPFVAPVTFPVYLLPGFLVPLAFAVHTLTLKRLLT